MNVCTDHVVYVELPKCVYSDWCRYSHRRTITADVTQQRETCRLRATLICSTCQQAVSKQRESVTDGWYCMVLCRAACVLWFKPTVKCLLSNAALCVAWEFPMSLQEMFQMQCCFFFQLYFSERETWLAFHMFSYAAGAGAGVGTLVLETLK